VTLSASATNVTSPLIWQPGGYTGANVALTPTGTATYTVTGSNACGSDSAVVTVVVNSTPVPAFTANVLSGCPPLCIQFYDRSTVSPGRITTTDWDFGNGDTSSGKNPIYCYQKPGTYSVKITTTSDSGCSSALLELNYITVYNNPNANFTASPQPTTILQPTIQFTDISTDLYGIAAWSWNFGNGNDSGSQLQNPTYTYQDTGTYCPELIVINIHGCADSVMNCLVIEPLFTLYIPSAFSPNGDGLNDVFETKGNDIKSFEMYVFDRWGTEIFHSMDIKNGWNGTYKNSICQEDSYAYVITVYDGKNTKHAYTGSVLLLK
jgi:gliding motility-associated-like protein